MRAPNHVLSLGITSTLRAGGSEHDLDFADLEDASGRDDARR